ncbi:MAG: Rne/Rng family ribonuclease [Sphingobacteriia bacterium]|nr:Rne/Rng family ribonuclease [Sphingobacteriia bacterium]
MSRKILIDATYPEEVRVVTCSGKNIEGYDYDTITKQQLKGNIYLARVTRVEPSLQAAFVEYMPNKHGFLSFSEIHPDYYLPLNDGSSDPISDDNNLKKMLESKVLTPPSLLPEDDQPPASVPEIKAHNLVVEQPAPEIFDIIGEPASTEERRVEITEEEIIPLSEETDELLTEIPENVEALIVKKPKIQDVIKKGQVILVQVIKEERGNKGASLTTFISLAGRYCVLMPNSVRQGGISRRISNNDDRKRIRELIESLNMPVGIGVIIRTAGADRSNAEIKRDFEYLVKLWNNIRETILSSKVPAFIHAEGDVIKRCIRDNYDTYVEEIMVQGEKGFKTARDFMKLLMSDHVNKVKQYKGKTPLLMRFGIEDQITALHEPIVPLSSGGYLVINHTEALVAIDINSGKSTSEKNVEETALKTNLEAAEEIAKQMRLRDLSGLIVVDFIDMVESKNRAAVENTLRNALQYDRAKIHLSRISPLGLLEISRQRLRPSLLESNTIVCNHCNGKGRVRAIESMSVNIMRSIETELSHGDYEEINTYASPDSIVYILNNYRNEISRIESRFHCKINFHIDYMMHSEQFSIDKVRRSPLSYFEATSLPGSDYNEITQEDMDFNFSVEFDENKQDRPNNKFRKASKWTKKSNNNFKRDNRNQDNKQPENKPGFNSYEVQEGVTETHEIVSSPDNVEMIEEPIKVNREGGYRRQHRNKHHRSSRKFKRRNNNDKGNYNNTQQNQNNYVHAVGEEHKELVGAESKKGENSSLLRDLWKRILD